MIEISNRTVIFNDFDEATEYEKKLIGTEQEYEKIIKNGTVIFLFEHVEVRENAKKSANETHEKISKSWGFGEQLSMF